MTDHGPETAPEGLSAVLDRIDVDALIDRASGVFEDREDRTMMVEWEGQLVPYFNQGDGQWADRMLGESLSIGAAGCAITSIAMVLGFYGRDVDPAILDQHLDDNDGYLGELVRWQVAFQAGFDSDGPELDYVQHMSVDEDGLDTLHEVLDDRIEEGLPTIAHVTYERGNHYVVVVGKNADGDYIINDPGVSAGAGTVNPSADEALLSRSPRGYALQRIVLHGIVE